MKSTLNHGGFFGSPARSAAACAVLALCSNALAQNQVVKPPIAQYWMDVATMSMAGMNEMPSMGALGGLFGGAGRSGGVSFGATRGMMPGRWLDLAVVTQRKPAGTQASQSIPTGQNMGPSLVLLPVQAQAPVRGTGQIEEGIPEQPKGRILFYWGCSETVRPGQPQVLDFTKASVDEYSKFMQGRAPRDNGARAVPGHAIWPNEKHGQIIPADASLVGEHALSGEGLPASLKFSIDQQRDFMPKLALAHRGGGASATALSWQGLPTARAYFLNAMGGSENEMVIWSSSELPDPGWGLIDYASNANVDKWLREKVLLATSQTQCAIPAGIFARTEGAMLRGIAYGEELNLAYPPRPSDKRIAWEPEWAAKVRVKSVAMAALGEDSEGGKAPAVEGEKKSIIPEMSGLPDVGKALKGLFGN